MEMSIERSRALAERQMEYKRKRRERKGILNRPEDLRFFGAAFLYGAVFLVICLALGEPRITDGNRVMTRENAEQVQGENRDAGSYQVTMNTAWSFDGGSLESIEVYVENVAENVDVVYFVLTPVSEPDHILYLSPELKPGDVLTKLRLEEPLSPGEYDCVVTYYVAGDSGGAPGIPMDVRLLVFPPAED